MKINEDIHAPKKHQVPTTREEKRSREERGNETVRRRNKERGVGYFD